MRSSNVYVTNSGELVSSFVSNSGSIQMQVKLTGSPMYTMQRRLGKGGYGFVYEGIRTQANRKSYQDKPLHVRLHNAELMHARHVSR